MTAPGQGEPNSKHDDRGRGVSTQTVGVENDKNNMGRRSTGKLVTTGRSIPIRGAITKMVSSSCIARLLVMAAEDQQSPMVAYINSPGGLASEALRIISTIDGIRSSVATFCRGRVGGAAAVIAAHGLKGYRVACPASVFTFKFDAELRKHESLDSYLKLLVEIVASDTQQSPEKVSDWFKNGVEFSAEAAQANGLVDQISTEPVVPETPAN